MIIKADKFFIQELQNEGYDLDYKKIMAIYKQSRDTDGYKKRVKNQIIEEEMMAKFEDKFD